MHQKGDLVVAPFEVEIFLLEVLMAIMVGQFRLIYKDQVVDL